jgi:predicted dinucleotide-binding enzyme
VAIAGSGPPEDIQLAVEVLAPGGSSSLVRDQFPGARLVKSLNQLSYHQVDDLRRQPGSADRVAMAAVGDDREAVRSVMVLIDALGFDPVDGGALGHGRLLEPDGSPYATTYTAPELAQRLERGTDIDTRNGSRPGDAAMPRCRESVLSHTQPGTP